MNTSPDLKGSNMAYHVVSTDEHQVKAGEDTVDFHGTELALSQFKPIDQLPTERSESLAQTGYRDGQMVNTGDNYSGALYALDLTQFDGESGTVKIAMVDWTGELIKYVPKNVGDLLPPRLDENMKLEEDQYPQWADEIEANWRELVDEYDSIVRAANDLVALDDDATDEQVREVYHTHQRGGLPALEALFGYAYFVMDIYEPISDAAEEDESIDFGPVQKCHNYLDDIDDKVGAFRDALSESGFDRAMITYNDDK